MYKGMWMRLTPAPGDNPNLGDGIRDEHLNPQEMIDPFPEPTPSLPDLPDFLFAQDDVLLPPVVMVREPMIDEPESHEEGAVDRGSTLIEGQYLAGIAHSLDHGAAAVHHHGELIERANRDTYMTQRLEADFQSSTSRLALVRGRNSLPENNPDGPPPQGHYVMRWIDRQFARRGIRTDQQPLRPYRAALAVATPEPSADAANAYTSPFQRLVAARLRKLTTPQVRRLPRPPDESAQADGTEDPQYSAPAYWEY